MLQPDHVARRVTERAVAHPPVLVGGLLHDLDARGLDLLEDLSIALYHIQLVVEWGESGRTRSEVFETLRSVDMHWEERQRQMGGGPGR